MATRVAGSGNHLRFFQVPFNLRQNELLTMRHLQHKPVRTAKGYTGDPKTKVSLMRACEEVGVNVVTLRSAESG